MSWKEMANKTYNGYNYVVMLSAGGWYCGYVNVTDTPLDGVDYLDDKFPLIDVHGGITFSGEIKDHEGYYIGWDYNHYGDALCPSEELREIFKGDDKAQKHIDSLEQMNDMFPDYTVYGFHHTAEEVARDCERVIDQLKELEKTPEKTTRSSVLPNQKDTEQPEVSTPNAPKWIPIKFRVMETEEVKEYTSEPILPEEFLAYNCELPDNGQEVLITTKYGVEKTTFYNDDGCYFEQYEDYSDVIAWMPLPEPCEDKTFNKDLEEVMDKARESLMEAIEREEPEGERE